MAERLTADAALALLANTLATGAVLVVLVTTLGPVSGAHLNPAVSLVFALRGELPRREAAPYALAQLAGGVADGPDALLPGFQRQRPHGPVLGDGVPAPEAAARLAEWLGFEKRGENDDRTAVLLTRRPA